MNWERLIRQALVVKGDANAVAKDKVGRRIVRRSYGKVTGSIARRWLG